MKTITVNVTAKIGKIEKTETFNYDEPLDFAEGIEMDGEQKAFNAYLIKRKTNFQDAKRRKMLDTLTKGINNAMANPEVLAKLAELGIVV